MPEYKTILFCTDFSEHANTAFVHAADWAKKDNAKLQSVKPSEIAHQAVELFHEKARTLEIQLISQLNPSLPHTTMDSPSIVRMLSNLNWNALEACDKDDRKPSHSVIYLG